MNLTPEQFAATRKALRAYDPKGTENLTDEHLDGMALSVALAIVTSAPDQGSGGVKKLPTDEMLEAGLIAYRTNALLDDRSVIGVVWKATEAARPKDEPWPRLVGMAEEQYKSWQAFVHSGACPPHKPETPAAAWRRKSALMFCRECGAKMNAPHAPGCHYLTSGLVEDSAVYAKHCDDPDTAKPMTAWDGEKIRRSQIREFLRAGDPFEEAVLQAIRYIRPGDKITITNEPGGHASMLVDWPLPVEFRR